MHSLARVGLLRDGELHDGGRVYGFPHCNNQLAFPEKAGGEHTFLFALGAIQGLLGLLAHPELYILWIDDEDCFTRWVVGGDVVARSVHGCHRTNVVVGVA
jgi:hypothetical protein